MWSEFEIAAKRHREAYERDVRLAWTTDYMRRQERLDQRAVDRLLRPGRRQTAEEMKGVIDTLRQIFPQKVAVAHA